MEDTLFDQFLKFETSILENTKDDNKTIDEALNIMNRINILSLFSSNETLDEVTTSSLAMLKMPYYVGDLYYRKKYNIDTRKQDLDFSKIYIVNFCNICNDYKLIDKKWKSVIINLINTNKSTDDNKINRSVLNRNFLVELFNEQRRLKTSIKHINERLIKRELDISQDEESMREFQLQTIRLFIYQSIDLLNNINRELEVLNIPKELRHLHKTDSNKDTLKLDFDSTKESSSSIKLLKINKINEVFGLGYPSLPSVTLDQWVDQQVAEGFINLNRKSPPTINTDEEHSEDKIDDPEKLKKERDFDDFKDNNRRGRGNRINQG